MRLRRLSTAGALFDWKLWIDKARVATLGDTTFLEAYRRTGRILNIPITSRHKHSGPVVLNYVSAPNVLVRCALY